MTDPTADRQIWKFPIDLTTRQAVPMPAGAKILHVAVQRGQLCLWALCNPFVEPQPRVILVFGTGHPIAP